LCLFVAPLNPKHNRPVVYCVVFVGHTVLLIRERVADPRR
jgi:hypothetical protein